MFQTLRAVCALSLLLVPALVFAQESQPTLPVISNSIISDEPEISLEELLRLAQQNNPQPQIALANLEATRARARSLSGLPSPTLQIVPGIGGTRESRDEEIIFSQPLDLFGQRRAQRGVLNAQTRRAQADAALAARTLQIEVKNAAANLFAAQESENLGASQVEIARQFRDAAARQAQLGDVPPVQVQRADLELSRAQNELENARAERLVRRALLNGLMGRAPATRFRVTLPTAWALSDALRANAPLSTQNVGGNISSSPAPVIPSSEASTVGALAQTDANLVAGRAQILPQALASHPDLVGAQASLEASRASIAAIGRSRFPQFELQARRNGVFDSPASTSLRAVISVPLFDFGDVKNQKRAALAEVRAQELQIALLRFQIGAQVEGALVRLEQGRAAVERYRTSIVPQTLDLLRKTQVGYMAGASTYLEVLEAQRATRQVQTEYLQALVGVRTNEAALEAALGANLPMLSGPIQNPTSAPSPDGIAAPGAVLSDLVPASPAPSTTN